MSSFSGWAWGVLLVAIVVLVYWPALDNGFVSDDSWFVFGISKLNTLAGLRDLWFKPGTAPQYNPLAQSVLWIENRICGTEPRLYHAVNIGLHAGVSLLLWRLLVRLSVPGAWLAAAIFAVHPVQVETVAWASEIKNLLSALFALLSILAYLRFSPPDDPRALAPDAPAEGSRWLFYVASLVLYAAAVLAKSATLTMPAVVLVIFWWKRGRVELRDVARLVPFFVIGLALATITIRLEKTAIGAEGPEWDFLLVDRVLIAGRAVWFYAAKLAWPYPLTITYPRWQIDASAAWQYLFPAAAVALVVGLWSARRRIGRGPLAAVLIFGGVLTPALGFFDVYWFLYSFVADHFQYHASMALIALAVAGAVRVAGSFSANGDRPAVAAAAGLLLVLGALSRHDTYAYKDNETIIRNNVAKNPGAWAGHHNLGDWLRDHNQHQEALAQYQEAARLFPQHNLLHNKIGQEFEALGRTDEAVAEFERALEDYLDVDQQYIAHSHLVQLLKASRRMNEMRMHAAAALRIAALRLPDNAQVQEDAGATFLAFGQLDESEQYLRKAVALNPRSASSHNLLGELLVKRGDARAAAAEFEAALSIDPRDAKAAENLRRLEADRMTPK
ncbi:MAG TPA: tetratricopeptide repeat protein [Pirellulales bacterium]|nr:tetratricopeptide repeat protein [Pirellulales bacterium]